MLEVTPTPPSHDWRGVVIDIVIIVSVSALAALKVVNLVVLMAVIGPLVGARLAGARASAAFGGSTLALLLLGFWNTLRRIGS